MNNIFLNTDKIPNGSISIDKLDDNIKFSLDSFSELPDIPDNEIWYTTIDESLVEPWL